MILSISEIFWELPLLKQVQFPWRILTITTFFASLSLGSIVENISRNTLPAKNGLKGVLVLLCVCFTGLNAYYSLTTIRSFNGLSFDYVASLKKNNLNLRSDTSFEEMVNNYRRYYKNIPWSVWLMDALEYRPVRSLYNDNALSSLDKTDKGDIIADHQGKRQKVIQEFLRNDFSSGDNSLYEIHGQYVLFPPMEKLRSVQRPEAAVVMPYEMLDKQAVFKKGNGKTKVTAWGPERRKIHVRISEPGQILVKTFYYPRWKAYVNGRSMQISPDSLTGLILIAVPGGEYDAELTFEAGRYRVTGSIISIIAAVIILVFVFSRIFAKTRQVSRD